MLHGKEGRGRSGRDSDLGVDVFDVASNRLGRDEESLSHFPVGPAEADQSQDVDLAVGQAARPGFPAQGVTVSSHAEDRFDCVVGELALFYFGAQRAGGRIWREPVAPRPIGRQRLESIRRREDSRRLRNAIAGQASVVAGSVEPFVVT